MCVEGCCSRPSLKSLHTTYTTQHSNNTQYHTETGTERDRERQRKQTEKERGRDKTKEKRRQDNIYIFIFEFFGVFQFFSSFFFDFLIFLFFWFFVRCLITDTDLQSSGIIFEYRYRIGLRWNYFLLQIQILTFPELIL